MKILLTGASGFTGYHFKQHAESAGHTVLHLAADLTDKSALLKEVTRVQPDAVVHLAAISFVGHADEDAFYLVNVLGTLNLLAALASLPSKPTKVLIASSANVYGNCMTSPIPEDQVPSPVNHYATSKLAMECMARTYLDRLPIVITRPFNYTGPKQAVHFLIPKLVSHFANRAESIELGNLHVGREFNDVRMVCAAYLSLLMHGESGEVYNVCSGRPYTLMHVLNNLTELTGHSIEPKVNASFVRINEVHRLCGNPSKLQALMKNVGVSQPQYALSDTLKWMLDEAIN